MFRLVVLESTRLIFSFFFFFFNDTAPTEIYPLSLHDALPIFHRGNPLTMPLRLPAMVAAALAALRSEEHTSELQSHDNLVCRLLLEKKTYPKRDTTDAPYTPTNQPHYSTQGACVADPTTPAVDVQKLLSRSRGAMPAFFFLRERAPPGLSPFPPPRPFPS